MCTTVFFTISQLKLSFTDKLVHTSSHLPSQFSEPAVHSEAQKYKSAIVSGNSGTNYRCCMLSEPIAVVVCAHGRTEAGVNVAYGDL